MAHSHPGPPNRKVRFWCCCCFHFVIRLPNHCIMRAGPGGAVLTRAFGKLVGKLNGFHSENESVRKVGQGCGCLPGVFLVCVKAAPFSTGGHDLPLILRKVAMGDGSRSVLSFRFCFCLHLMNLPAWHYIYSLIFYSATVLRMPCFTSGPLLSTPPPPTHTFAHANSDPLGPHLESRSGLKLHPNCFRTGAIVFGILEARDKNIGSNICVLWSTDWYKCFPFSQHSYHHHFIKVKKVHCKNLLEGIHKQNGQAGVRTLLLPRRT